MPGTANGPGEHGKITERQNNGSTMQQHMSGRTAARGASAKRGPQSRPRTLAERLSDVSPRAGSREPPGVINHRTTLSGYSTHGCP